MELPRGVSVLSVDCSAGTSQAVPSHAGSLFRLDLAACSYVQSYCQAAIPGLVVVDPIKLIKVVP